ncbi:MAG: bifunctional phosphopantothenoylcysteine decarboxylase/phosphopantothenate--cysteine ligase CoaBC [Fimbriimonadaceae bacterium]|nr:bifunctional phosphopantothenoylcysteine decarboxylase/phosphopantothenate--cysteine ligase CoaBC [Fimbriimonadaceae bacterium]
MPNLVLGVSGSVAAYRAADLARELMRAGFTVRVCLTDAAQNFVTPALFETLTGQPCLIDTFEEPERGRMAHIDWAREAAVLVIAPASANTINKIAHGIGDDMLTTLALVFEGPMVIAPAMNPSMYANENTQESARRLEAKGAFFVEPTEGDVIVGETGLGKLASTATITETVLTVANRTQALKGKRVLITSGPTQEPIDDVRFLSNRSSGKMGIALAKAALLMGAEVTLVTGPTAQAVPLRAVVRRVHTAQEMLAEASSFASDADLIIGAAAVADYHPVERIVGKRRSTMENWSLELTPNPDIIAALSKLSKPGSMVIGFAAEPTGDLSVARAKLAKKGLHAIAHNDVSKEGIGFESDENELTLIWPEGEMLSSGRLSKLGCALWLLGQLVR